MITEQLHLCISRRVAMQATYIADWICLVSLKTAVGKDIYFGASGQMIESL